MRARLYTAGGTLGFVDLVDGADVAEVVRAIREHRLFVTPVEPVAPLQAATTLPAQGSQDVTLPGDRTVEGDAAPKRRRSS